MGKTVFDLVKGKTIFLNVSFHLWLQQTKEQILFHAQPLKMFLKMFVDFRVTGKIFYGPLRPCAISL